MKDNKDSNSITTKDSSQIQKPKIFKMKKIKLSSLLSSAILHPFIINNIEKYNYITKNEEFYKKKNSEVDDIIYDNFNLDKILDEIEKSQINISKISFNKIFIDMKNNIKLKIKKRKTEIDSFLKKCKTKFSKALNEMIYNLLKFKRKKYKIPQKFVTNINIDTNKKYLNYSMLQIYEEYNVKIDLNELKNDFDDRKAQIFIYIMNKTYKNLFEEYLNSKKYLMDCITIRKIKGIKFEIIFKYVSKIFIKYYSYNKGNKLSSKKGKTNI